MFFTDPRSRVFAATVVFAGLPLAAMPHHRTTPARVTSLPAGASANLVFEPGPSPSSYLAHTARGPALVSATGVTFPGARNRAALRLVGANAQAAGESGPPARAKLNFYLGNDRSKWRTGVATSESVSFHNVYPGIDVTYHDHGGQLEYDFHVAPGADPSLIRIALDGAGPLLATSSGAIVSGRHPDVVLQQQPEAWQNPGTRRQPVGSRAVVRGSNQIAFSLGRYNHSASLTIDPTLVFSTYLGGTQYTGIDSVVVDSQGNSYVTGWSDSPDYPVMPPGSSSFRGGDDDIVVSKFDPSGQLLFSTYIGGSGEDEAYIIAFDPSGNLLLTGETESTNFPVYPAKVFQGTGTALGSDVAFAVKLDSNGNLLAATYIGGHTPNNSCQSDYNEGFGIASDPSGNVYVAGQTCAVDFPTQNALQTSVQGSYACFIIELTPNLGSAVYSTYFGGNVNDYCNAIAVDSSGAAYVTGGTLSSNLATKGAYQNQFSGGSGSGDAFAAKIAPNGQYVAWYTYLGGPEDDDGEALTLDSAGDIFLTGYTQSRNFPVVNPLQAAFGGGNGTLPDGDDAGDVFISEIDPTGSKLLYSTFFGSSGLDVAYGITLDSAGDIYVAGATTSTDLKATAGAAQPTYGGNQDAFVLELAPGGGAVKYFTYFGGSQIDDGNGFTVSSAGNIYLTGNTASTNFPLANAINSSLTGNEAGFLTMIGSPVAASPVVNAVTNGASFTHDVEPGQLATVFGKTLLAGKYFASNLPLPTTLNGVSVTVNGLAAPLLYADPGQVNFQIPWETQTGQATVKLSNGNAASLASTFTVTQAAPGIFTYGNNRAVAQNYPSGALNGPNSPAGAGNVITVYLTGIGPVTVPGSDGVATPTTMLSTAPLPYSATVGGQGASITFLGLAPYFVGLAQANINIPTGLSPGDYPLVIAVNGVASNAPLVAVK